MAGINLSQSLQEKQEQARGNFFDKGFYFNLGVLVLTLAVYGGVHWYLGKLESESAALDTQAMEKIQALKGPEAQRVADFRERVDDVKINLAVEPNPTDVFKTLESLSIPNIRLTKYEEDWKDQLVKVAGETDNLKFIAQEMLAFKKIPRFTKVTVGNVSYEKASIIKFNLVLSAPHTAP